MSLIVYAAIFITGLVSYVTLRLADPIYKALGRTGIQVFGRILGLILAGISIQFILDGLARPATSAAADELFPRPAGRCCMKAGSFSRSCGRRLVGTPHRWSAMGSLRNGAG